MTQQGMAMKRERGIQQRSFAAWPEDAAVGGVEDMGTRIYMQYLGVLSLLGRVTSHLPQHHSDRECVEQAFVDANVVLRRRGSTFYFEHAASGGFAMFENTSATTTARQTGE